MHNPTPESRDMLGRESSLGLEQALDRLSGNLPAPVTGTEELPLAEALNRITAKAIRSPEDLPLYSRSTMDGYAVRSQDTYGASESLPAYMAISGEVRMGEFPEQGPPPGTCFRIATGGLLPPGTDAVVMFEHTVTVDDSTVEVVQAVAAGANSIAVGEDVGKDEVVLEAGHRLRSQDLGLLAGLGIGRLQVSRQPRVGIIATGDEIVPFDAIPSPGQIRNINSVQIAALVQEHGGVPVDYGIVADDQQKLSVIVAGALQENDLVLLSGSSSVGTRDLGEQVIAGLGPPGILVHGVAVKPGKPVIIARAGDKLIFGLPGHPVSAAVSFELFVRPAIRHLAGRADLGFPERRVLAARLARNLNSAAGRTDIVRVRLSKPPAGGEFEAHPVLGRSGALSTMVRAHGFIVIPEHRQGIRQDELVAVQLFD